MYENLRRLTYEETDFTLLLTVAMLFSTMTTAYASSGGGVKPRGVFDVSLVILSYEHSGSSSAGGYLHFGHSCILVFNYSSYSIWVGNVEVSPGEYVSVGLFDKVATPNHEGVWYNIEGFLINNVKSVRYAAAACDITESGLNSLNSYIRTNDYYYLRTHNCATFAQACWDAVAPATYQFFRNFDSYATTPEGLIGNVNIMGLPTPALPSPKSEDSVGYYGASGFVKDPSPVQKNGRIYQLLVA